MKRALRYCSIAKRSSTTAWDVQTFGHAEGLVEDDDHHGVVVGVADRAQATSGLPVAGHANAFDLDAFAAGRLDVPARLAEAAALATVVGGDDDLGDVADRVVVGAQNVAGLELAHDSGPVLQQLAGGAVAGVVGHLAAGWRPVVISRRRGSTIASARAWLATSGRSAPNRPSRKRGWASRRPSSDAM